MCLAGGLGSAARAESITSFPRAWGTACLDPAPLQCAQEHGGCKSPSRARSRVYLVFLHGVFANSCELNTARTA